MKRPGAGRLPWYVVVVTLLVFPLPVAPATIVVNGSCTLSDAINAANNDDDSGGLCPPGGSGADALELTGDVTLAVIDNFVSGPSGLPVVATDITVAGGGFTIQRSPTAPLFRIFNVVSTGTLTLDDVTVSNGGLRYADGAGILSDYGRVNLVESTVSGNTASVGGGIRALGGIVSLVNSTVSGNVGFSRGGGISSFASKLTVTNSTITGNRAMKASGGGLFAYARDYDVRVTRSTVADNTAGFGGGIYAYSDQRSLVVTSSTVSSNYSEASGGGIVSLADAVITNSTLSGNAALQNGGGIFTEYYSLTITNSTLSGNSASGLGGGVYSGNAAEVTLNNSIVAGSTSGNCYGFISDGGNNFADDESCGAGFGPIVSGVDFDAALADNGGPTQTHALLPGSVAIDAAGACGFATDQRGFARSDGACDSGAFEFDAVACEPTCSPGELLVGLLSDLRTDGSCGRASCLVADGPPLTFLCSLPDLAPGAGYYYLE